MERGIYNSLLKHKQYKDSTKNWYVELINTNMYWYELIVNGHDEIDTKRMIFDQVKQLKKLVKENLEKRFVYFICSREKVRFCSKSPCTITNDGQLRVTVKIGKSENLKEITTDALYEESGLPAIPTIEQTGRFITFEHSSGNKLSFSIHDFLLEFGVNLGINTQVQYVGYTKNPNTRPLNGVHGGLSDILYRVSNDDNDILIFFNLFKVLTIAENDKYNLNFTVANSLTDEITVDKEGFVIEKCFIFYFDSENQSKNKTVEKRQIENDLNLFIKKHKIGSVSFHYEVDNESEYYRFSSTATPPKHQHVFTASLEQGHLSIQEGSQLFDEFVKRESKGSEPE